MSAPTLLPLSTKPKFTHPAMREGELSLAPNPQLSVGSRALSRASPSVRDEGRKATAVTEEEEEEEEEASASTWDEDDEEEEGTSYERKRSSLDSEKAMPRGLGAPPPS